MNKISKEVYIAGPFFNEEQKAVIEKIKNILKELKISYFSPGDELPILEGKKSSKKDREKVFIGNCNGITYSNFVIAVIDDFDPGTLWEMGFAFNDGRPILAYSDVPDRGLNIMLEQSCVGFVNGEKELKQWLIEHKT